MQLIGLGRLLLVETVHLMISSSLEPTLSPFPILCLSASNIGCQVDLLRASSCGNLVVPWTR